MTGNLRQQDNGFNSKPSNGPQQ
jgi:hypothetical protein